MERRHHPCPCTMEKGQKMTAAATDPYLCYLYSAVFTHVLLARINPLLTSRRRPQQSGFTAGRSTTDAILALRLLSELHWEFDRPLHVASGLRRPEALLTPWTDKLCGKLSGERVCRKHSSSLRPAHRNDISGTPWCKLVG